MGGWQVRSTTGSLLRLVWRFSWLGRRRSILLVLRWPAVVPPPPTDSPRRNNNGIPRIGASTNRRFNDSRPFEWLMSSRQGSTDGRAHLLKAPLVGASGGRTSRAPASTLVRLSQEIRSKKLRESQVHGRVYWVFGARAPTIPSPDVAESLNKSLDVSRLVGAFRRAASRRMTARTLERFGMGRRLRVNARD